MLLSHLGRTNHDAGPERAARKIESAVALGLAGARVRTPDLGGRASTSDVTNAVIAYLEKA
jgi:isocitrate/isopropylmalate dehydrogenase